MTLEIPMLPLLLDTLYSIVLGAVLGLIYDAFRIVRISLGAYRFSEKKYYSKAYESFVIYALKGCGSKLYSYIITAICDVMFFTVSGCIFSLFLYVFNFGIFRWFFLVGAILGFRLYGMSLGKAVLGCSEFVSQTIVLILNFIITCIVLPIRFSVRLLSRPLKKIKRLFSDKLGMTIDTTIRKRYTVNRINKLGEYVKFN